MSDNVKNVVYVDLDTSRDDAVRIGKLPDFNPPTSEQEDRAMCDLDIKTMVEGIIKMGVYMEDSNYVVLEDTVEDVIAQLKQGVKDNMKKPDKEE